MKPQDIIVALVLTEPPARRAYAQIAEAAAISVSEAHAAVSRLAAAGLVDLRRRTRGGRLLAFLVDASRIVFPPTFGAEAQGIPTGADTFDDPGLPGDRRWVWPTRDGTARGMSLQPLYRTAPDVARASERMHQLLAAVDMLRAGSAREIEWAARYLQRQLGRRRDTLAMPPIDPSRSDAVRYMFTVDRLRRTAEKWLAHRLPGVPAPGHPLVFPIAMDQAGAISSVLGERFRDGTYEPSPAAELVADKPSGGSKRLAFPCLIDSLVAMRLADELQQAQPRDERVFSSIPRPSSLASRGAYADWSDDWSAFVEALQGAAHGRAVAIRTDVREFYGSIRHDLARQVLAQTTGAHPAVVQLVFRCATRWLPSDQPSGHGLPIDPHGLSLVCAQALLHNIDRAFEDSFDVAYRRFMDDTVIFCADDKSAEELRRRHVEQLRVVALQPNEAKTRIESAESVLLRFANPAFQRIDDADPAGLEQLVDLHLDSDARAPHAAAPLRHLFYRAARIAPSSHKIRDAALLAIERLETRRAALAFLSATTLGTTHLDRILDVTNSWPSADLHALIGCLGGRTHGDTGALARHVTRWLQSDNDIVQSRAALLAYELSGHDGLRDWHPKAHRAPIAASTRSYIDVCHGFDPSDIEHPDHGLSVQLLDRLRTASIHELPWLERWVRHRRKALEWLPLCQLADRCQDAHVAKLLRSFRSVGRRG